VSTRLGKDHRGGEAILVWGTAMKCVNCDYEFFSQETLKKGVCPACGKSLTVEETTVELPQTATGETDAKVQLNAQVSVAINTRRIALVLILGVVLSVGTALVGVMASIILSEGSDTTHVNTAIGLLSAWVLIAAAIMIFGLYNIVYNKRFTRL
jgi:predicted RNA-binding Zn-ribbon protein involved in translation (DUF1610 family)